jgi:prefoldin subunit 5
MEQQFSEKQLIQMAQQEEAILKNKQMFIKKLSGILRDVNTAVDVLKEVKAKQEKTMMNIGAGVLIEVEITNRENCLRAFSENGYKKEKITDTEKWLLEKKKNVETQLSKITADASQSERKLNDIITILRQIESEKRKMVSVK